MTLWHSKKLTNNMWRRREMSKKLFIVDMQYMFHRHKYRIKQYEEKNGKAMLSYNGQETARLYFTMKDLYSILNRAVQESADVVCCFDTKSARKKESDDYKANRSSLEDVDVQAIQNIEYVVKKSGLANVKFEGFEADDMIASVVRNRASEYDSVEIYTPDADLCALVGGNVSLQRYKSVNSKHNTFLYAHDLINGDNLESMMSTELKTYMPYNAIILFKCTVGDTSDGIKGIKGFGPAAFRKFAMNLRNEGVDFSRLTSPEEVEKVLIGHRNTLGEQGLADALESLKLVQSRTSDEIENMVKALDIHGVDMNTFKQTVGEFGISSLA